MENRILLTKLNMTQAIATASCTQHDIWIFSASINESATELNVNFETDFATKIWIKSHSRTGWKKGSDVKLSHPKTKK